MFKVGQKVITTEEYEGLPKGSIGIVAAMRGVCIGAWWHGWGCGHSLNFDVDRLDGYWVDHGCVKPYKTFKGNK